MRSELQKVNDKKWVETQIHWGAQRDGKVIAFLKENPLSTADEVFAATECGVSRCRYIKQARYNGKTVWRLNHKKLKAEGL